MLTHGFALDAAGKKMSKSIGNTVDPLAVVNSEGADILRLWVASTNYFDDVRIGNEVLGGQADVYRKLRNTFRYLLGSLDGWSEAERVPVEKMPELERWVLHRVAEIDAELRVHTANFDFNPYMALLNSFANSDLSAFYFDIRKDSLYCDAPASLKRRACPHRARHAVPRADEVARAGAGVHRRRSVADTVSGGGECASGRMGGLFGVAG